MSTATVEAVLLFAGQGAQEVGMGQDLVEAFPAATTAFEKADAVLGRSLSSLIFEGPEEELTKTANCQPALFVHGLALLEVLQEQVPSLKAVAAAGLSLGEMTAHTAAGTFGFEDGAQNSHGGPGWRRFRERGSGVKFIEGSAEPLTEVEPSFAPGDRCFHQKFGMGNVRSVDRDKLTIDFDKAGEKRVVAAFVTKP